MDTQFNYDQVPADKAEELRELAGVIRTGVKVLTQTAVEVGRSLIRAKADLTRGVFLEWCRLEAGFEPRTAQLYMNLAALFERYGEDVYLVPLSGALDLAAPSVDETTVVEILTRARRGERLTVEFVKECIRRAKGKAGEPVPVGAAEMSAMVVAVLDISRKAALQKFLGDKPGPNDRHFMKNLRERLAEDLRQSRAHMRLPLARRLPAA
jgi:hypothetical protein